MKIGVVFPQTEIGQDPAVIRDYAQAVEAMGYTHMLAFDSVVGANPDRPGGWDSQYTYRHAFHEPFVLFGFCAGGHAAHRAGHGHRHPAPAADGARRQAGGRGGRPLGRTAAPGHRRRLEPRRVRGARRELHESRQAGRGTARGHAAPLDEGAGDLRGTVAPRARRRNQSVARPAADSRLDGRRQRGGHPPRGPSRRWLDHAAELPSGTRRPADGGPSPRPRSGGGPRSRRVRHRGTHGPGHVPRGGAREGDRRMARDARHHAPVRQHDGARSSEPRRST